MLKGFYLSLFMGGIATAPVPREVIDALESVQITQTAGQRSGFQLTFALSKNGKLARELVPSGFFDPLSRVQVVVTVAGSPTVLMDGLIAQQQVAPANDPGTSTLTITGEDVSLAMSLTDLTGLIPYPAMPREGRVALILAKYAMYGLVPLIIPSILIDVPLPIDRIPMQQGTDLDYINTMASDVGYVFYVTPGPTRGMNIAYWGPEIRYGEVQPTLSVNMDAQTNVESLSFTYDGLGGKLVIAIAEIPNTTVKIPVPIPPVGILRPPLAAKTPIPLKLELLGEGVGRGIVDTIAIGLARQAQSADAVTGQGALNVLRYGRVLKARSLVDVRGATRAYDGTYYVKSVTHNIKRGEYKQSFSLAREGLLPLSSTVRT